MRYVATVLVLLVAIAAVCFSQQDSLPKLTGPYLGQKPPGDTARPFAPAFFGSMFASFHGGIVFSPDGQAAYWQAMLNDESKRQAIFESRLEGGSWTKPRVTPSSELVRGGRDDSPFISPDGERLFFLSSRLLRNEFYRGDETVPHIPDPGELPQMIPQNPAT